MRRRPRPEAGALACNTPPVWPPAYVADPIRTLSIEVDVLQKNWQTLIKPKAAFGRAGG